ncbi:MAG TPA: YciI family protein [Blastocatellia bacterium]|nr:YciI family protein [Blastocatellia bacterium]
MQYLLLIYHNEQEYLALTEKEREPMHNRFRVLMEETAKTGNYLGGNQLQPTATATTVRVRNGKTSMTDGPFAETREQLGGYIMVEAKNLDEATAIAARVPIAETGSIEVRPIVARA